MPSAELLKALRRAVLNEMEKRAKLRGLDLGKDYRTILYEKLDGMRERREQLGNPYREPTAAERADLQAYLTETAQRHAATGKR
jgi:hypothetical protein